MPSTKLGDDSIKQKLIKRRTKLVRHLNFPRDVAGIIINYCLAGPDVIDVIQAYFDGKKVIISHVESKISIDAYCEECEQMMYRRWMSDCLNVLGIWAPSEHDLLLMYTGNEPNSCYMYTSTETKHVMIDLVRSWLYTALAAHSKK